MTEDFSLRQEESDNDPSHNRPSSIVDSPSPILHSPSSFNLSLQGGTNLALSSSTEHINGMYQKNHREDWGKT
jgi:hypothetical protein